MGEGSRSRTNGCTRLSPVAVLQGSAQTWPRSCMHRAEMATEPMLHPLDLAPGWSRCFAASSAQFSPGPRQPDLKPPPPQAVNAPILLLFLAHYLFLLMGAMCWLGLVQARALSQLVTMCSVGLACSAPHSGNLDWHHYWRWHAASPGHGLLARCVADRVHHRPSAFPTRSSFRSGKFKP